MKSPLEGTPLAHHEPGNEYCPHCDRYDVIFPRLCVCGGLVHRQGDADDEAAERYLEICDSCGGRDAETDPMI